MFVNDEYWHGNEPGQQIPFIYNFTTSRYKIQRQVLKFLRKNTDGAGCLSGNDDAGQMIAWLVFASMGFYRVDPVRNEYESCAPLFNSVLTHLMNGKTFSIIVNKKTGVLIL